MNVSVFDAIGPIMIGPSSSHTAGAAKLARIARSIVGSAFNHVSFGLHGSFAKTYKGHGTDIALVAGALGLMEDDEKLVESFQLAGQMNVTFDFYELELDDMHENSVLITFYMKDGRKNEIIGSSIGGGQIIIKKINRFETEITAQSHTLVINQYDKKGVVSEVARVLANNNINIGIMKVNRTAKGEMACCIIETDSEINKEVIHSLKKVENVLNVHSIIVNSK